MVAELSFADARRAVISALERAADTLRRLPMPRNGRPAPGHSSWPAILAEAPEGLDSGVSCPVVLPPKARAISELDRILPWLATLDGPSRAVVWARALGVSWPRLARESGATVGRVRYRWNAAIDCIVVAALRESISTDAGAEAYRRSCQADRFGR